MSFTLQVLADRWWAHADGVRDAVRAAVAGAAVAGDLVPVAKGNGYGFGIPRLAREATRLGTPVLAVGTVFELEAAAGFPGDLLVMTPYEPVDTVAAAVWDEVLAGPLAPRLIRTIASPAALRAVAIAPGPARVVVEALTSTGRFGFSAAQLDTELRSVPVSAGLAAGTLTLEGLALHLPLTQPSVDHRTDPGARWHDTALAPVAPAGASARVREALAWAQGWTTLLGEVQAGHEPDAGASNARVEALTRAPALWVSHLDDGELRTLRAALPGVPLHPRIGTRLWLGDRDAFAVQGTVLAVHPQRRGQRAGYRQRRAGRDGALLVVSGGTAHGVALEAPSPASTLRQRAVAAGSGALEAGGRALSPFTVGGRQRWFAEPPHVHVSLVRLPSGVPPPSVGDQVRCDVRMTTAAFDRILGLE